MTKSEVRAVPAALGLRTADKPDSQDVCFITSHWRASLVPRRRIPLTAGDVVDDRRPARSDAVDAVELVTVGQRRGLGAGRGGAPRFVVGVDPATATVTVGPAEHLLTDARSSAGGLGRPSDAGARARADERPRTPDAGPPRSGRAR